MRVRLSCLMLLVVPALAWADIADPEIAGIPLPLLATGGGVLLVISALVWRLRSHRDPDEHDQTSKA